MVSLEPVVLLVADTPVVVVVDSPDVVVSVALPDSVPLALAVSLPPPVVVGVSVDMPVIELPVWLEALTWVAVPVTLALSPPLSPQAESSTRRVAGNK
jgi:hypothetical protein